MQWESNNPPNRFLCSKIDQLPLFWVLQVLKFPQTIRSRFMSGPRNDPLVLNFLYWYLPQPTIDFFSFCPFISYSLTLDSFWHSMALVICFLILFFQSTENLCSFYSCFAKFIVWSKTFFFFWKWPKIGASADVIHIIKSTWP